MSAEYRRYFDELQKRLSGVYDVARTARKCGLDPKPDPEPEITLDIAERVEKLVGPKGVGIRIRELGDTMDRQEVAFKIAEEIVYGRFGHMEAEKAADQAVRTGLAILTEGITVAPTQGVTDVKFKQNPDSSRYLAIYFAGPIRPAGGTAQALTLVLGDFIRKKLGLNVYKPSENAVMRFLEEVRLYERKVRRFQYHVTDEVLSEAVRRLPVEATGVGTDPVDVSSFRDVPGIETNRIRGGALIVVVDGVAGRAKKLLGTCQKLHIDGWEFLSNMSGSSEGESSGKFMDEIIIGRPVFSFPSAVGGFRLRYGRARNTGLAAVGVHPATMIILKRFLTTGVQLRIELPGKSAIVTPVDSIEPPVVRVRGGSVVRVDSVEAAEKLESVVERILFVGDVLINAGDFLQNNESLLPSGYDESQWRLDLKAATNRCITASDVAPDAQLLGASVLKALEDPYWIPSPEDALKISKTLDIPLHPRYTYSWSNIDPKDVLRLRDWLLQASPVQVGGASMMLRRFDAEVKGVLEKLLVPHEVVEDKLRISEAAPILEACLSLDKTVEDVVDHKGSLDLIHKMSTVKVNDKAPVFVGARMGRPEKAKERKLNPYVHVLFPVGNAGGPERDIIKAARKGVVSVELERKVCPNCGRLVLGTQCKDCNVEPIVEKVCPRCGRKLNGGRCPTCNAAAVEYGQVRIELGRMLQEACNRAGCKTPELIKGVKSLMNEKRIPESLEKGVLRAKYGLSVFKDGTIRFDVTDAPLTHFKPAEIGVSVEKLRKMGYTHGMHGRPLESPEQMLELRVQDIIVAEECGEYFVRVAKFLDDELVHLYGLEPMYRVEKKEDLIGALVLGLAPHTSAAVLGRILGFTHARVCYAHPLWHAAKRRNCDGDEDALLLALDPLVNFSQVFLPSQIGGMMDAPLFIIPVVIPSEVDREAYNLDVISAYPPSFFEGAQRKAGPSEYKLLVDTVEGRLGSEAQFQGFSYTTECSNINLGSHEGAYTRLETMLDKLNVQLELSEMLNAVDVRAVATGILTSHFLKDIMGNLRAFTSQSFRCVSCNRRYRRIPLMGNCPRCGGKINLTVYEGGISKYIDSAENLVGRYDLGIYYVQRLQLVRDELGSLFEKKAEETKNGPKQIDLSQFLQKPTS